MITVFVCLFFALVVFVKFYQIKTLVSTVSTTLNDYNAVRREFREQLGLFLLCGKTKEDQEKLFNLHDLLSDFLLKDGKIMKLRDVILKKLWGYKVIPLEIDEENDEILICGLETGRGILAFSG